jgi:hypothetical protein
MNLILLLLGTTALTYLNTITSLDMQNLLYSRGTYTTYRMICPK